MGCQDGLATDHDDVTVHDLTCRADQVLELGSRHDEHLTSSSTLLRSGSDNAPVKGDD